MITPRTGLSSRSRARSHAPPPIVRARDPPSRVFSCRGSLSLSLARSLDLSGRRRGRRTARGSTWRARGKSYPLIYARSIDTVNSIASRIHSTRTFSSVSLSSRRLLRAVRGTERWTSGYVNDPSAGSPTETLLRLLLPLNDQVWSSSRQHRQCRRIAAHQSEDLTKSFNR